MTLEPLHGFCNLRRPVVHPVHIGSKQVDHPRLNLFPAPARLPGQPAALQAIVIHLELAATGKKLSGTGISQACVTLHVCKNGTITTSKQFSDTLKQFLIRA